MTLKIACLLTLLTLLTQHFNRVSPHSKGVEVLTLLSPLRGGLNRSTPPQRAPFDVAGDLRASHSEQRRMSS